MSRFAYICLGETFKTEKLKRLSVTIRHEASFLKGGGGETHRKNLDKKTLKRNIPES